MIQRGLTNASHFSDNLWSISSTAKKGIERKIFQSVLRELGLPCNEKDSFVAQQFVLLGFEWDVVAFTVSIPEAKRVEIVNELIALLESELIELKALEKIVGKLTWASQIIQTANCYASILWKLGTKYNKITAGATHFNKVHYRIYFKNEPALKEALSWFKKTLSVWSGTSYLRHFDWLIPQLDKVLGCASDASKIGGSYTTPSSYGYFVWCPCCVEKAGDDMTLLEIGSTLVGFGTAIASQLATQRILWLTDNFGSSCDYKKGFASDCPVRSQIVAEMHSIAVQQGVDLILEWVPRECLKRTDILTRGSEDKFLAMPGESRVHLAPHSCESVFVFDHNERPVKMGFAHFHPERSC